MCAYSETTMNMSIATQQANPVQRIRSSFQPLAFKAGMIVDAFYERLGEVGFNPGSVSSQPTWQQKRDLTNALGMMVNHASNMSNIEGHLLAMRDRHFAGGMSREQFTTVRNALVEAIGQFNGARWNDTLRADWQNLFDQAFQMMFAEKPVALRAAA